MCSYNRGLIKLIEHQSIDWEFDFCNDDGEPIDVSSYRIKIKIAENYGKKRIKLDIDSNLSQEIVKEDEGKIKLKVKEPNLNEGDYKVELIYIKPDGFISKPTHTYLRVYKEI